MIKDKKGPNRPYKLIHQLLCIKNINFQRQLLVGVTEMTLVPSQEFVKIKLNCRQAKIYKILVNDSIDVNFTYHDPSLEICQEDAKSRHKSLDQFSNAHFSAVAASDPDRGHGEIIVHIPAYMTANIAEGKNIKLTIEFAIEKPLGGIHFVGKAEGSLVENAVHLYTAGFENCSRMWFPCIDAYSEPCTWKLEFTVDAAMVAVSSGELVETVYTSDMKKKTYHYQVTTPTCAPKIGLAVGPFEIHVDPNMHEVTHFCLPHLLPLLKETCSFLHEAFEFYEELLSFRYPYTCYKQIFVDEAYSPSQSYATMAILDTNLLHSKHIIDQTYDTRRILSRSLAEQFFGCYITMQSWADAWLTKGIAHFLGYQYYKKAFGNNEYRMQIMKMLDEVVEYEQMFGGFPLDPSKQRHSDGDIHFSNRSLQTMSPLYVEAYTKKSTLVVRMMEERIGRALLLQVFNKLLTLASVASQQKVTPNTSSAWSNMLLSSSSYAKAIFVVTGKDIESFLAQWVHKGGHAKLTGTFVFNRKRNTVELEIKQLDTGSTGVRRYMGPLMVWIQELDGSFKHNLQIEENTTKHDITCHSKSRRNKKKKIPLCTGEEVDMDLTGMDADSPVLWIRVDPDMQLLRQVVLEQPDYQWQYQLRYERDVTAQAQAIRQLEKFPGAMASRKVLTEMIENNQCFYRIRCEAAMCLKSVANAMSAQWTGPPLLINTFRKLFGSYSCPHITKLNDFSVFQLYFLQKAIPVAMAGLRTSHGICPQEVISFLLGLFKYNDNSKNKFSDNYYRASLITALSETVTPAVTAVLARTVLQQASPAEALSSETKLILEEITRYFNLEKLMPCYKHTVTVACLKAIRRLQKMGHLPSNPALFKEYAQYGVFSEVRIAAIEALVDVIKAEQRREDLDYLLDMVEGDQIPSVRHAVVRHLVQSPPFTRKDTNHPLNTPDLVDRLWKLMNSSLSFDQQLRCAVVDLYLMLFGRGRPACLPKPEFGVVLNLKEKIAISHFSEERMDVDEAPETSGTKRPVSRSGSPENSEKRLKVSDSISEVPPDERLSESQAGPSFEPRGEPVAGRLESSAFVSSEETEKKEKKKKDKDKEDRSHSKPHKEKKKKKKKHKHKNKHKREHKDRDDEKERESRSDAVPPAPLEELEEGEISGNDSAANSDNSM